MCGRYRLSRRKQIIEEHFDVMSNDDWTPRYNIAPTQPVPVIRRNLKEPRREFSFMRWGLIPVWSKGMSGAAMMINARSETATTKPKKLTEEYHSKFSDLLGALDLFELSTEDPIPLETWIGVAQAVADASGYRVVLQAVVLQPTADDPNFEHIVGHREIGSADPKNVLVQRK